MKGDLASSSLDRSENLSAYIENSFFFLADVALVTGTQFLHATRDREDRFLTEPSPPGAKADDSGRTEFNVWSPKVGLLWNVDPTWQVYRQHLAQRRGAELRREHVQLGRAAKSRRERANRDDL